MLTGEVTCAPFAGEQIVTEGLAGFSGHGAAAKARVERKNKEANEARSVTADPNIGCPKKPGFSPEPKQGNFGQYC
jgi:hypothetical protein